MRDPRTKEQREAGMTYLEWYEWKKEQLKKEAREEVQAEPEEVAVGEIAGGEEDIKFGVHPTERQR